MRACRGLTLTFGVFLYFSLLCSWRQGLLPSLELTNSSWSSSQLAQGILPLLPCPKITGFCMVLAMQTLLLNI